MAKKIQNATRLKFTPDRKSNFIEILKGCGTPRAACEQVGVAFSTVCTHRRDDPEFAHAYAEAIARFREGLLVEMHRRATEGVKEPVFARGQQAWMPHPDDVEAGLEREDCRMIPAYVMKKSDSLLLAMAKANFPQYSDAKKVGDRIAGDSDPAAAIEDLNADDLERLEQVLLSERSRRAEGTEVKIIEAPTNDGQEG